MWILVLEFVTQLLSWRWIILHEPLYCFYFLDNLISWSALKQGSIPLFSAEAEYCLMVHAIKGALWVCLLFVCFLLFPLLSAKERLRSRAIGFVLILFHFFLSSLPDGGVVLGIYYIGIALSHYISRIYTGTAQLSSVIFWHWSVWLSSIHRPKHGKAQLNMGWSGKILCPLWIDLSIWRSLVAWIIFFRASRTHICFHGYLPVSLLYIYIPLILSAQLSTDKASIFTYKLQSLWDSAVLLQHFGTVIPRILSLNVNYFSKSKPRRPRPSCCLVRPRRAEQVSAAVQCAVKAGVKVQPRSGGHSFANYSLGGVDGAFVVDLVYLQMVTFTWKATIIGGTLLGYVIKRLHDAGMRAIAHGICPQVSVEGGW